MKLGGQDGSLWYEAQHIISLFSALIPQLLPPKRSWQSVRSEYKISYLIFSASRPPRRTCLALPTSPCILAAITLRTYEPFMQAVITCSEEIITYTL